MTPVLEGFDPMLLLVLNLAGTVAFGISGGLAGVRACLDSFGVVVLAAVVAMAGGIMRDVLVREIPVVLHTGLYAIPALLGATVVSIAFEAGFRGVTFPILGAALCLVIRLAALHYDINLPHPPRRGRLDDLE